MFENGYVPGIGQTGVANYDIAPDGKQFVFVEQGVAGPPPTITIVLDWFEELWDRVLTN